MFACSGQLQVISVLDSQSKFQMLTLFSGKFARNISTNISTLGQRTNLKFGELSSLFIFYNIVISWLNPPNGFLFHFNSMRDIENDLFPKLLMIAD